MPNTRSSGLEGGVSGSPTEQAQRIGRPAAPAPHGLRRGMSSAYPCCSHDVRQRGYVRVLAWQPPNARRGLLDLAQEGPIPCESEACPAEKLISQRTTLNRPFINPFTTRITEGLGLLRRLVRWMPDRALWSHVRSAASPGALHLEPVVPWHVPTARSTHHVTVWLLCAGCGTTSMRWCESC